MTAEATAERLDLAQPAERLGRGLFAAAAVAYVAMRLWNLTAYSLWGDEIFSLRAARMPVRLMFDAVIADAVHPPLFYVLLKAWVSVGGDALWWLKLFPVLTSVLALVPFALLCRELKLRYSESSLALALLAVNPYLVLYAQELRMYSMLFALTLVSLWAYVRFVEADRLSYARLAVLFGANVLLVYTHYFGWLIVGLEVAAAVVRRPRWTPAVVGMAAAVAACFAPWAYTVVRASEQQRGLNQNFRDKPAFAELLLFFGKLAGPATAPWAIACGILVVAVPVAVLLWRATRNEEARVPGLLLLAAAAFLPAIATFAASNLFAHSMWRDRYLIISAGPYLLLAAIAALRLPSPKARAAWAALLCVWAVAGLVYAKPTDQRVDLESIVAQMVDSESGGNEDVRVYAIGWRAASPVQFYLEQAGASRFKVVRVPYVDEAEGEHFWLAYAETRLKHDADPPETLRSLGYRVGEPLATGEPGSRIVLVPAWKGAAP